MKAIKNMFVNPSLLRFGMKFEEAKKNAKNKQKKLKNSSKKFITMQEYIKTFGSKEIKLPWGLQ